MFTKFKRNITSNQPQDVVDAYNAGVIKLAKNDWLGAIESFRPVTKHPSAMFNLAVIHLMGRSEEAVVTGGF
ncbi:MAG: hypothetical protein ACI9PU_002528 [Ascidiaceihabitans sp.]|jgi:hypothetical protein|tara:strand:+ start:366 stop:581 length:216 start_codon:yes stop_codon:yes gene_type:complete